MQQRDQANQGAEGGGVQLHRRRSMHVKLKELCGEHLDECTTEQCDDSLPVPSLKPSGVETLKQRRKTIDAKKFKELAAEGVGTETVLGIGTASGSFDAAFATACSLTSKALGASPLPEARSSGRGSADTVGDRSRMLSYRRSTFSDKIQPQPPRLADTTAISKKPFEERCNLGITGPASQPNDAKGSSTNRTENQDTPKLLTRPRQTVGGTLTSSLRKSLEAHRKSLNSFTAGELQREIQGVRFSLAEKR